MLSDIARLVEIQKQIKELKAEEQKLQAQFYPQSELDLADTKNKTSVYTDEKGNKVLVTQSDTVTVTSAEYLKIAFGAAYKDFVKEDVKYDLSPEAKRILTALCKDEIEKTPLKEYIDQMPVDDKAKKALLKKLKGINFETDKKNLMNIGKLSEQDASDYAYFVSGIIAWERFMLVMRANYQDKADQNLQMVLDNIKAGAYVDSKSKISIIGADASEVPDGADE